MPSVFHVLDFGVEEIRFWSELKEKPRLSFFQRSRPCLHDLADVFFLQGLELHKNGFPLVQNWVWSKRNHQIFHVKGHSQFFSSVWWSIKVWTRADLPTCLWRCRSQKFREYLHGNSWEHLFLQMYQNSSKEIPGVTRNGGNRKASGSIERNWFL